MQNVSELWKTLRQTKGTETEYRFFVNDVGYGTDAEVSHNVENKLFETFGIGNAFGATLKLELYAPDIPKGATVRRECRLVNGEQASEWIPKGTFYIVSRGEEDGLWSIKASDAMRKAEKVWEPFSEDDFPMSMSDAVTYARSVMGETPDKSIELDERSVIPDRTVDYPANDMTFRQLLEYVAAAGLGNFIITDENKLRLVPLLSAPEPTSYLVDQYGNPITFGGVKIIV